MSDTNPINVTPATAPNEELLAKFKEGLARALEIERDKSPEERQHTAFDPDASTLHAVEFLMQSFHHMSRQVGKLDQFEIYLNDHLMMAGYFLQRCKEKRLKLPSRKPIEGIIRP